MKEYAEQKLELVSRLVSAQPTNKGLALYKQTLEHDFMQFAATENALKDEAGALKKLQNIQNELELIAAYPQLHTKSVIAVGGGFSAGKSEFISSLFTNTAVKLPVGIQPTTAIPAYVLNSNANELIGCTPKGGVVNLHEIDPQFHEKLSHDFTESLNLKEIMPFMILGTKMGYAHTCFIDTPGYNPAGGGHTAHDVQVAKEFLEKASALLWVVSAENGTLPQSDIDFLQKLELKHKKLYVVINKADVKPPGDLEDIAEEVQDKLDDEDIQIAGISVYSAIRKKEYLYVTQNLEAFLHGCDARLDTHKGIIAKLREVYHQYRDAIEQAIRKKKKQKKDFQQLKYQVAKIDLSGECDAAVESIEKMQRDNMLSTSEEEQNLENLKKVMRKFGDSVKAIFSETGDNSEWGSSNVRSGGNSKVKNS